jgi:hypothetical protein
LITPAIAAPSSMPTSASTRTNSKPPRSKRNSTRNYANKKLAAASSLKPKSVVLAYVHKKPIIGVNKCISNKKKERGRVRGLLAVKARMTWCFPDFFLEGNIGHMLFPLIRSFLDVGDLVAMSKTGYAMQRTDMARTFTCADLYTERKGVISKMDRIRIGTSVINRVTLFKGNKSSKRPQRLSQDRDHTFWANLYHPDELHEIRHIVDTAMGSKQQEPFLEQVSFTMEQRISEVSCQLFKHKILALFDLIGSYLDVCDLHACQKAGFGAETCQCFTVNDVVHGLQHTFSPQGRMWLGREVARRFADSPFAGSKKPHMEGGWRRPYQSISGMGDRWRRATLYHPEEREEVESVVTCFARRSPLRTGMPSRSTALSTVPILVSAFWGGMDVTERIAMLRSIRHSEQDYLLLLPPQPVTNGMGAAVIPQPKLIQSWFVRMFGLGQRKQAPNRTLNITVRDESVVDQSTRSYTIEENVISRMPLRTW